jgi:hypothetical protein
MGATAAAHPADPILQAYGLGKLDDVSSASVSKHLEQCIPASGVLPNSRPTISKDGSKR